MAYDKLTAGRMLRSAYMMRVVASSEHGPDERLTRKKKLDQQKYMSPGQKVPLWLPSQATALRKPFRGIVRV